jgi:chemotaxis regulatin CheY-phosphate phosphatase CheZ
MTQVSSNSTNENEVTETNVSSEEDYKLIEDALLQNPRGRWFLEEYIQRNRPEDTQKLLSAIQRIENTLSEKQEAPAASQEMDPIRMSIIEMSKAIAKTREEIASIKPNDEQDNQIITATEELSAIVESTENATNTILEAAEEIQEAAWSLRETGAEDAPCDKIDEKTTDMYTACSFQDITGQRTTKVVQALCYIENRVNAMIDIWDLQGETSENSKGPIQENTDTRPDSHLLNGPALKGDGLEQGCVDTMLTDTHESSEANGTSDQNMVDEMSFDAIGEQTDAVPNSEIMDSEDVDAMSFDAIDVETDAEPAMSPEAETSELSTEDMSVETEEPPMDLGEPVSEIELTSDQAMEEPSFEETGNEFALEANDQAELDASQELSTGTLEINEAAPEEESMLAVEPEEILATELVTPITNPLDEAPEENFASLDDVQSDEMQASNEAPLDLTTDVIIEPQSPVEPSLEETNPLLQESHDLDDIDVAEFETDLASTDIADIAEGTPSLDPMSAMDTDVELSQGAIETTTDNTISGETPPNEMDLSEMDFGDIEITDLDSPEIGSEISAPETGELEMDLSETNLAEATENPITSQDQINNLEEADIENLTEMQEQILLNE